MLRRTGIACTNSVVENSKPKQVNKIPHVLGAGVMAQQLRTLAAVPDDPGFIPRLPVMALNHLQLQFQGICRPLLATTGIA